MEIGKQLPLSLTASHRQQRPHNCHRRSVSGPAAPDAFLGWHGAVYNTSGLQTARVGIEVPSPGFEE